MAVTKTVTKKFTENYLTTNKSEWSIAVSSQEITVTGASFTLPAPTLTAKYVNSNKNAGIVDIKGYYYINGQSIPSSPSSSNYFASYQKYKSQSGMMLPTSMTSGTTYTIPASNVYTGSFTTSTFFPIDKKSLTVLFRTTYFDLESSKVSGSSITNENLYQTSGTGDWSMCSIVLDAPPTITNVVENYATPHYVGLGSYSVSCSVSAKYGGNISSVTLRVGSESATFTPSSAVTSTSVNLSAVPREGGELTPTISVTDSRGQTTTQSLTPITVGQYNVPSVSFNVYRTNSQGVKDDDGTYGLIDAVMNFTDVATTLTTPTVSVTDSSGTVITPTSITWYSSYSNATGVSDVISNWSTISDGDSIYGLVNASFSTAYSYQFTITETDALGGSSQPITQTLSTSFYTIDFQAGGQEVAFGAPANDSLAGYPDGLFKCDMHALFNNDLNVNGAISAEDIEADSLTLHTGEGNWYHKETDIDLTDSAPASDQDIVAWRAFDENGYPLGGSNVMRSISDNVIHKVMVCRQINNAPLWGGLSLYIGSTGTKSAYLFDRFYWNDSQNKIRTKYLNDDTWRDVLECGNSNGNLAIGYGGYSSQVGATNIYGNAINLYSRGNYSVNNPANFRSAIGFSGGPSAYFSTTTETISLTVAASNTNNGSKTLTKSGYYPYGVVGWQTSGTGVTSGNLYRLYLSDRTSGSCKLNAYFKNGYTSQQTYTITAYVLWVATSW